MMNKLCKLCVAFGLMSIGFAGSANIATNAGVDKALSLQNLERERAAFIQDMLHPSLTLQQRLQKIAKRQRQLSDMERMVMRDERLLASKSMLVKHAFDNYDTTFLVHAGAEQNRNASEQWLAKVNLSSASILNTQAGFRK